MKSSNSGVSTVLFKVDHLGRAENTQVGRNDEQSQGLRDQTTKPVQKGDNGETRSDALDSDPLLQDAFKRANGTLIEMLKVSLN